MFFFYTRRSLAYRFSITGVSIFCRTYGIFHPEAFFVELHGKGNPTVKHFQGKEGVRMKRQRLTVPGKLVFECVPDVW